MVTNSRKRYFHIDKNASSEQIYALLVDVESADEDDIDNLLNDSDTELIAEGEVTQATGIQDTSLTTPEANFHVIPNDNQSKKKKEQKRGIVEVDQKGFTLIRMEETSQLVRNN